MKKIIIQNGVSLKNPKPKTNPAKKVEIAEIIAQILATKNQDTQYAPWLAPKIFRPKY